MEEYKKLAEVFSKIDSLQRTAETIIHDSRLSGVISDGKIKQIITLKEIVHEVVTSDEVAGLVEKIKEKTQELDDWQKVNFGFMQDFCLKRKRLPFEAVSDFTQKSFVCRKAYMAARKAKDFSLVSKQMEELVSAVQHIADCQGDKSSPDRYASLLKIHQVDYDQLSQLCVGVGPLLKTKVQKCKEEMTDSSTKEVKDQAPNKSHKTNTKKVIEKFGLLDIVTVDHCTEECVFGDRESIRIGMSERGESVPTLLFLLGQALYIRNLPYAKWDAQPICSPTSISMYAAQGFLFSHFLLEDKDSEGIFGFKGKQSYSDSIMGADKFVALTHLMVRFSLERSLINGEVSVSEMNKAFQDDLQYYFKMDEPTTTVLDVRHWFRGEFCYYPAYLKGMIAAGQIFHFLKTEGSILKSGKATMKKLINWLSSNIHEKGARHTGDDLIQKLTGESLDCRFYKKFSN